MKNKYFKEPNYIHYSNCHEDVLQLKKYLPTHTKRVLSIASALDNSLALLENDEIKELLKPVLLVNRSSIKKCLIDAVSLVKKRGERDNISIVLVKAYEKVVS